MEGESPNTWSVAVKNCLSPYANEAHLTGALCVQFMISFPVSTFHILADASAEAVTNCSVFPIMLINLENSGIIIVILIKDCKSIHPRTKKFFQNHQKKSEK